MKKYFLLLLIASSLAFVSCEVTDPLKDQVEEASKGFNQQIDYTLTAADYTTLQKRIIYLDSNAVSTANAIAAKGYFTDEMPGSEYVPMLLDILMPNLDGAKAHITFNYNGAAPDNLAKIAGMDSYTISQNDFQSIDSTLGFLNYFAPPFVPANYIPNILRQNVKYEGSSDTVVVKYQYSANPVKVEFKKQINAELAESFNSGTLGVFKDINVKGNQTWNYTTKDQGSASINGFDGDYFDNENWLVSPTLDLADVTNTKLQFKHNVRYYGTDCLSLMVTNDVDSTVQGARWSEYPISDPNTDIGVFVYSKLYDLSSYDGTKIKIAFKYISTASSSKAPEWSISEVKIGNYGYKVIGGGDTYLVQDYYQFDSESEKWTFMNDIHRLNRADYESIGMPQTAFSQTLPSQDYLPKLANKLYATAAADKVIYFVYDYNNGKNITLADKLTKTGSDWVSTYAFVRAVTEPYSNTDGVWKFDPTVYLTMEVSDYQMIVDYVKNVPEYAAQNTSTYDDSETYFSCNAHYPDFDVRPGSYNSRFSNWQEDVSTALIEGLLPFKYPKATKYVSGVEAFYHITVAVYNGATVNYTFIFGVSKDAPNPEFYLVDGPFLAE